jgi:hypothetical protein
MGLDDTSDIEDARVIDRFKPKNEHDFKKLFFKWLGTFTANYLKSIQRNTDDILIDMLRSAFFVEAGSFEDEISPDIDGDIVKSVTDLGLWLQTASLQDPYLRELRSQKIG